jgi:uncharacterized protein
MLLSFEPIKLAKTGGNLSGVVNTQDMPRIAAEIEGDNHSVITYELKFYYDAQGICVIDGQLDCLIYLKCYRCLQACPQTLKIRFLLSPLAKTAKVSLLPEAYEPIILEDDNTLNLLSMLEEEILLSIPLVPKHDINDKNCMKSAVIPIVLEPTVAEMPKVQNPFSGLKDLTSK